MIYEFEQPSDQEYNGVLYTFGKLGTPHTGDIVSSLSTQTSLNFNSNRNVTGTWIIWKIAKTKKPKTKEYPITLKDGRYTCEVPIAPKSAFATDPILAPQYLDKDGRRFMEYVTPKSISCAFHPWCTHLRYSL